MSVKRPLLPGLLLVLLSSATLALTLVTMTGCGAKSGGDEGKNKARAVAPPPAPDVKPDPPPRPAPTIVVPPRQDLPAPRLRPADPFDALTLDLEDLGRDTRQLVHELKEVSPANQKAVLDQLMAIYAGGQLLTQLREWSGRQASSGKARALATQRLAGLENRWQELRGELVRLGRQKLTVAQKGGQK